MKKFEGTTYRRSNFNFGKAKVCNIRKEVLLRKHLPIYCKEPNTITTTKLLCSKNGHK